MKLKINSQILLILIILMITFLAIPIKPMSNHLSQKESDQYIVKEHQVMPNAAYVVSIPPGETISIVLPALCLNFSKKTPGYSSNFKVLPQKADKRLQRLLALHEHILKYQEIYQQDMKHIQFLEILSRSNYIISTPNGGKETKPIIFKYYLDEALQYAIWQIDPNFLEINRQNRAQIIQNIRENQRYLQSFKASLQGHAPLDKETQAAFQRLKKNGQLGAEVQRIYRYYEMEMARAEYQLKLIVAIETLAEIMCEAAKNCDLK